MWGELVKRDRIETKNEMETKFVQSLWSLYRDETGSEGAGTESDDDDEEEEGTEAPTMAENGMTHTSFIHS